MARILILNGPNLNLLGTREPDIYGRDTLDDIRALCEKTAGSAGHSVDFRQTNSEGELITWVQEARGAFDALIINPAAYTHTSVALHDALKILAIPVIEVHISNPHAREPFRHVSYVSPVAKAVISGCGIAGYEYALNFLKQSL